VKYILVGIIVLLAVVGTLVSRVYFSKNAQQSLSSSATWGATSPHCVKQPDGLTVKTKTLITMPNGDQGEIDFESVIFNKGRLRSISGLFKFRPARAAGNPNGHGGTSGGGGTQGSTTGPGARGDPRAGSDGPPGAMTYRQTTPSPTPPSNATNYHHVDVAYNPTPIVEFGKTLITSNKFIVPNLPTEAFIADRHGTGLRFDVQLSNTGKLRYRMVPLSIQPEYFRGVWTEESDDDLSEWVNQILHLTEYYQSECQVQFSNRNVR
jgi:hypothetical protein